MEKTDVIKLLGMINAAYPNMKPVDAAMVEVWFDCLKDIELETAKVVLKKHILESTFPPTIADIRKQNAEVTTLTLDGGQAWGEVMKAIRNYGSYREEEALKSMSPLTGQAVRSMGWQEICMSEKPDVVRGQFLKIYAAMEEREHKGNLLPSDFKAAIENSRQNINRLIGDLGNQLSLE